MIKKIAILTSGGDAPGMNNAVVSIVNSALSNNIEAYLVYEGYKGLVEDNLKQIKSTNEIQSYISKGGTFIYSARLPEFANEEVRKVAVKNLNERGIEALIVVGGDGSYMGAAKLTEMGIKTIGLPGTIDNDISSTDYTIGFFTTLQSIQTQVEMIRDTAESHDRVMVVETMGRHCGDLAIHAAIATGAEVLSVPERFLTKEQIIDQVKNAREKLKKRSIIVLVTEHQYNVAELAKEIELSLGYETRATVLGHTQRGGVPNSMDRVIASRMGNFAVKLLIEGKSKLAVGIKNDSLYAMNILQAVELPRPSRNDMISAYEESK